MDTGMEEVLKLARELGAKIGAHGATRAFMTAAADVGKDRDAQAALKDYLAQRERIEGLAMQQKPIEVDDKRRLAELEGKVASHAKLKQMTKTQADYLHLMQRVQSVMDAAIEEAG